MVQKKHSDYENPNARFVTEPEYPEFAWKELIINAVAHQLCKALHNLCYAKLIVMQRKFLFYRKQGLFSFFNLA